MNILTAQEMRMVEAAAVAQGLDYLRLMENAGSAAARLIRTAYPVNRKSVAILCGRGNNGGDGFVIARKLLEAGAEVTVVMMSGAPTGLEAREMLSRIRPTAVTICSAETEPYVAASAVTQAELLVDAVYGIGFHGKLPDEMRHLFRLANASQAPLIAVDVPSGLDCDTGEWDADALRAERTVTFTAMKPALLLPQTAALCGKVEVLSIGIEPELIMQYAAQQTIVDETMVRRCFAPRPADSNKGSFGTVLSVCGSFGMAGAAFLAAKAALRCGAGLVTAALPRSIYPILAGQLPEAVYLPLPETAEGQLAYDARVLLRTRLPKATAVVLGCGLGTGETAAAVVWDVLEQAKCPVVLDADGINCVAAHIDRLKTVRAPLVLTPHPGEMARLLGVSVEQVQKNRVETAERFAGEYGVVLVLKGHKTVIAAPGKPCLLNLTGNPGMATGGSGDVLAGMIGSFLAQGLEPADAAMCGVYLHGAAGDRAAARLSQRAMLPTDLLEELGGLFLNMEK